MPVGLWACRLVCLSGWRARALAGCVYVCQYVCMRVWLCVLYVCVYVRMCL